MKFLKVMFGTTSGANKDVHYKLDKINVADRWNPNALSPKKNGRF